MNDNTNGNGSNGNGGRRPAITAYQAGDGGKIQKDERGHYIGQALALWPSKYEGYIGSLTLNGREFDVTAAPGFLVRSKESGHLVAAIRFGEKKDGGRYPVIALAKATSRLIGFLNEEESAEAPETVATAESEEYEEDVSDIPF